MARVYNFSAGPGTLPVEVLETAQADLLDWHGTGMSVMEMSHRGDAFVSIAEKATADLRKLLDVPEGYSVLFLQGGAAGQFAGVPLNLMGDAGRADYIVTGNWGKKAVKEAGKYGDAQVAATGEADAFTRIPPRADWQLRDDAAYVHYTPNETIQGVEFPEVPDVGDTPLVADMSSSFLSQPVDVSKFGVIYAGAQKNAGPAGVTMVIVRDELMGRANAQTPMVLDYKQQADADSMLNTPPCFAWYMCGLTFEWILANGGVEGMAERNARKAQALRLHRRLGLLPQPGGARGALAHERAVSARRRQPRQDLPGTGRGSRPVDAQGSPLGRRHARIDLQRDARRGRGRADRLHARLREGQRLTGTPPRAAPAVATMTRRPVHARPRAAAAGGRRRRLGPAAAHTGCIFNRFDR